MLKVLLKEVCYQLRWNMPIWLLWFFTMWWPDNRITIRVRGLLHRPFIRKCGWNFQIATGVSLLNTHKIEIGNDVYIGPHAWLNGLGGLVLEDEVVIGPYVTMSSLTHCYKDGSFRFGGARSAPVRIGHGSWLAAHVSVAYGTTIGPGCLIAANSAVTKDIPPGVIAGGVPAEVVEKCEEQEPTMMSRSGWKTSA